LKNLKVSVKLILGFSIGAALTLIVGIVGFIGMNQMQSAASNMYNMQTYPMPYMAKAIEYFQQMRINTREYMVGSITDDFQHIENINIQMDYLRTTINENLDVYESTILDQTAMALFTEARRLLTQEYVPYLTRIYELAKTDDIDGILRENALMGPATSKILENFEICLDMKVDAAFSAYQANNDLYGSMLVLIIAVALFAVGVAMWFAFYISGLISKPVKLMSDFMRKAGTTGDISTTTEEERAWARYYVIKDEIGQMMKDFSAFIDHVTKVADELETIASGDLTSDIKLLSNADTMGKALQTMERNLNAMFGDINASTAQVSTGSKQIADGAQSLAQGSTQQAAAVEELSSSISEIATKTKENASMAGKAANLASTIKQSAEKGSSQMDQMMDAVKEINQASQNINKVISVIDNIAFQTNILALNAAVEAARAGQHGKGFAVVAEEVRSLASKSAEAAKETGALIASSMEKAELGARIADETAASLVEIVAGINESNQIVTEIAKSSEEQSAGIEQINRGIDQVAQVVQQNSATAEESAAASEEMSGQSSMLEELISQFKLKNSGTRGLGGVAPALAGRPSAPKSTKNLIAMPPAGSGSGDFGKY